MAFDEWEYAAELSELEENRPYAVKLGKKNILLVRIGNRVYANLAKCTHYGAPLKEGIVVGNEVVCPWHAARFKIEDGRVTAPPALQNLTRYEVKIEEGKVYVRKTRTETRKVTSTGKRETVVIIGAGGAGTACAQALRDEGYDGKIRIITAESSYPYDRPNLSKEFLTGEVKQEWMFLHPENYYSDNEIEIVFNEKVMEIDLKDKKVILASGGKMEYDKLVLATGAIPRTPDISGVYTQGFYLFRSMSDASAILSALEKSKRVVIIGDGFLGLEIASSLREKDVDVELVGRSEVPLRKVFGERIGGWIKHLHKESGTIYHSGRTVREIRGVGKVKEVLLDDGTLISTSIVIAAVGVIPAVDYLEGTGITKNNGVIVNQFLETPIDDIYAAGDIAIVPDPITREKRRIEHWVEAQNQGIHVARVIVGKKQKYSEVPFFWTHQCDKSIKYFGYASRIDSIKYRGSVEDGEFIAGYFRRGRLRAVAGCGMAEELLYLGELIKNRIKIKEHVFEDTHISFREFYDDMVERRK